MKELKIKEIPVKGIITATALCLASTNVLAAMMTVEDSFGVFGSSTAVDVDQQTAVVSIAGFDTSLGTLTGVSLTAYSQIIATGTSQNNTLENGNTVVTLGTTGNWEVVSGAAFGGIFERGSADIDLAQSSDMAPGEIFNFELSDSRWADMSVPDFSVFASNDMIDFTFYFDAATVIRNFVGSDRETFTNTSNTGAWGQIVATYTYEPTPVPEPGVLALFAAGLFGVGLRRKQG